LSRSFPVFTVERLTLSRTKGAFQSIFRAGHDIPLGYRKESEIERLAGPADAGEAIQSMRPLIQDLRVLKNPDLSFQTVDVDRIDATQTSLKNAEILVVDIRVEVGIKPSTINTDITGEGYIGSGQAR